jgi:hypothetical protein
MEPEIKTWLLENATDVQRRGLEVLYEGESIDVVRMRDTHGVGVWAYFKEARKSGKHGELPEHAALTSRAARYIHFRFVPLSRIFQRGIRFRLWSRDLPVYSSHDHGIASETVVFNGPLGKKKTKEIVEWAAALEATLPMLIESAKKEHARWEEERRELCQSVRHTVLSIEAYNGETKTSSVRIGGQLRLDQIAAIAEVLRKEEA